MVTLWTVYKDHKTESQGLFDTDGLNIMLTLSNTPAWSCQHQAVLSFQCPSFLRPKDEAGGGDSLGQGCLSHGWNWITLRLVFACKIPLAHQLALYSSRQLCCYLWPRGSLCIIYGPSRGNPFGLLLLGASNTNEFSTTPFYVNRILSFS
jgi:hypothetical protein